MRLFLSIALPFLMGTVMANDLSLEEFKDGNHHFTAKVYKELAENSTDNFAISPLSIETILALAEAGAKGETAHEIRTILSFPDSSERIQATFKELLPTLRGSNYYNLTLANKIYLDKDFRFDENFEKIANDVYLTDAEVIEFKQPKEAADKINSWVSERTKNKITNLIDADSFDEFVRLVLVNALYFSGQWATKFSEFSTSKRNFFTLDKQKIKVDIMQNTEMYNYYESEELDAKFLEIPYEGGDLSLIAVLPNKRYGLPELEKKLDKVFLTPNFTQERVQVSFPKFVIEHKVLLNDLLQKLGLNKIFQNDADFSGLTQNPGPLYVSQVVQKTYINITESGTEASAASGVLGTDRTGLPEPLPEELRIFEADHPFLFYIIYRDSILFTGRFVSIKDN